MLQQRLAEMQQQVVLLHVAAAAKGIDLELILNSAACTQQQLAATAHQQLLAAAAATASKGIDLQTILSAAAAQQQLVAATAQQHLLVAAAAAVATGPGASSLPQTSNSSQGLPCRHSSRSQTRQRQPGPRQEGEAGARHSNEDLKNN